MNREREETLPIIIALIVAMAPHTPNLPLWINLWCLFFWGYLLLRLKTGWPMPSAWLRHLLTFLSILGLLATFRQGIGGDAFVGLLALMAAIKPFEMPTHRHRMITILLTYFIIITSLFRSDSLFILLYMLWSVFITTTALVRINAPGGRLGACSRMSFSIQAGALPLVLVLFLVFPRLPGSIVGLTDRAAGKSGFSNQLSPGSVSRLIQDQSTAFRVEFPKEIPKADQLYWRGIVFTSFDGRTWSSQPSSHAQPIASDTLSDKTVDYTLLLPPTFGKNLMALDHPVQGPSWARISTTGTMVSLKKMVQKSTYKAASNLPDGQGVWTQSLPGNRLLNDPAIQLTGQIPNPGARRLALKLGKNTPTPAAKAEVLLSFFKNQGFSYTTSPPVLRGGPVDDFLLNTKTGYCEHYASAFAFMMNILGVPARVVGGYLGGELNPYGNYLIVRQAYAHAWVEYYDPPRGWVRTDPTLAVKPERLSRHPDGSAARAGQGALSVFRQTGFILDALNLKWETWFTGYSFAEQMAWLKVLGLSPRQKTAGILLALATTISLALFFIIIFLFMKRTKRVGDPVTRAYGLFLKKMNRIGLAPEPNQGPLDFFITCQNRRPDLSAEIQSIMDLYVKLRYKQQTQTSPGEFAAGIGAIRTSAVSPDIGTGSGTRRKDTQ